MALHKFSSGLYSTPQQITHAKEDLAGWVEARDAAQRSKEQAWGDYMKATEEQTFAAVKVSQLTRELAQLEASAGLEAK